MEYKLTQFSPGAGCGCKIAPRELETILRREGPAVGFAELLVGNETNDDAAVWDLGDGRAVVSTTDFFTPIVDGARDFGRIAATNAISDVYAMGGRPIMAIAILGWPLDKLPAELAREVIEGAREVCAGAGIPLAGGHSVNIATPIFGLAVTGMVGVARVKKNNSAEAGCRVFLTKPLGIGLVTTAEKRGVVKPEHAAQAVRLMTTLNAAGADFAALEGVRAMTDVTGFGLAGHAVEMAEGSGVRMMLEAARLPRLEGVGEYMAQGCMPGGTARNWASYGHKVDIRAAEARAAEARDAENIKALVCDPQTSGGLLVAVRPGAVEELRRAAAKTLTPLYEIGRMVEKTSADHPLVILR
jgi:selenide,water dikinase